jgi:serine/threonine protein phosphatase 1
MRTLAIGDIHGCCTALLALLDEVKPQPDDQLVFLGDYLDRGPDTRAVLEMLIRRQVAGQWIFLRGNHECMMLEAREDFVQGQSWQECGGLETLRSYRAEGRPDWPQAIPESHWNFLAQTKPYHEMATHIFVHACLDPDLDLADQSDDMLYWEFFERIRPHKSGKVVVCGHTPQAFGRVRDLGFAVCIDTGVVYGGWLTCYDTVTRQCWQANQHGKVSRVRGV